MKVPADCDWELIIVDNNSHDNTREIIHDFAKFSGLKVKYVFESRQGLSSAKNAGVAASQSELVAFTDDDILVDRNWLISIVDEFTSDPSLSGIGGRVELLNKGDKPVSIRTSKERNMFTHPSQLFTLLPGANSAFYRTAVVSVGGFDPEFGAGTRLQSAEDSDFYYRALKRRFKIIYSPDVVAYHNHGRTTDDEVRRLNRGYVIGRGGFYCKHILRKDPVIFKLAYGEIYGKAKRIVKNFLLRQLSRKEFLFFFYLLTGVTFKLLNCRNSCRDDFLESKISN